MIRDHDTIAAPATAAGGALAVIRVSGDDALPVCDRIFRGRQPLAAADGYTVHYGRIADGERTIDDVLTTVFRAPHSYTGEDAAEIACHGSPYVVSEILRLLLAAGARMAEPGEFTVRAYLAGKMDLSQAEAVADVIASSSQAAHALASNQMRGGYSEALETLREKLLNLASLLELELDFSEEEVQFADRTQLRETMERIAGRIGSMRDSFSLGNAIKQGVAVAIAGAPNVGKSTLLNRLLQDERALVSDIAGTTRDVIEETTNIDGVLFRFLDTAGIRATDDRLEKMGIERTLASISRAQIVIYLLDATQLTSGTHSGTNSGCAVGNAANGRCDAGNGEKNASENSAESCAEGLAKRGSRTDQVYDGAGNAPENSAESYAEGLAERGSRTDQEYDADLPIRFENGLVAEQKNSPGTSSKNSPVTGPTNVTKTCEATLPPPEFTLRPGQRLLTVFNKLDAAPGIAPPEGVIGISAKNGEGVDRLCRALRAVVDTSALYHGDAVVSNSRHYEALTAAGEALRSALDGLRNGLPTDLLSEEIRQVIRHIGTITGRGTISSDEILHNIFSKFCIGK